MAGRFRRFVHKSKRIPLIGGAVTGLLLIGSFGIVVQNEVSHREQAVSELQVHANVLAHSVSAAVDFDDPEAVAEAVAALRENPKIQSVTVSGLVGPPLARYAKSTTTRGTLDDRLVQIEAPIVMSGAEIGKVSLTGSIDAVSNRIMRYMSMVGLVGIAIVVLLILLYSHRALKRVNFDLDRRAVALSNSNTELKLQIGKRSQAEDDLRQAQKMQALGQLTGGIAHDFNNLLQSLTGSLELIKMRATDPKVSQLAERGLQAGQRAVRLTGQLLAFSRVQKLNLEPVTVHQMVESLQNLLPTSLGSNYTLIQKIKCADAELMVDPVQLELAIINLIINARDATQSGGTITLRMDRVQVVNDYELPDGEYLDVTVDDTGSGMSDEVRDKAFDPFFTTKGPGKGTGLGLSMVYGMAHQMGGRASIKYTGPTGTSICILLPLIKPNSESDNDQATLSPAIVEKKLVMLVDDDDDVRLIASSMLEALGHDVVGASDGPSAISWLATTDLLPDLIILDFAMPGMNGAQVALELTKLGKNVPIMFASGFADTSEIQKLTGEDLKLIKKPFTIQTLASAVGQVPGADRVN